MRDDQSGSWAGHSDSLVPAGIGAGTDAAVLRGLVSLYPRPEVRAQLAQALLDARALDDAIAQATLCLNEDPALAQAWVIRAEARRANWEYAAAATDFERAAALAPDRPMILVSLAACHVAMNRPAAAETVLRQAVGIAPRCKQALANLGSVLVRRGALMEAEAPCRAALALDVGLVAAHQNLSGILAETDPMAARAHRDAAYRRQQIFIDRPPRPERSVLVLAAADAGNVPLRALFDPARTLLITWYVEYATSDQDDALPPFDLVFNAIGDPDLAPILPSQVARVLAGQGRRVLNRPDRVARTARAKLPRLLEGIAGVVVPPVACHEGDRSLAQAVARLGFPVLVRPLGSHGGIGLTKADDPQALARAAEWPGYATKFVAYQSDDGFYRKYRVIFVDRQPYACHLAIGPAWMVHHCTSGMEHDAARREEEQGFLSDPAAVLGAPAMAALRGIGARLDLDYAGVDFGVLPDGRLLLFEANATMLVQPETDRVFSYRNPAVLAIQTAFEAMLGKRMRISHRSRRR